jgi:uncharacterized BrkB/YihY/UPF0761 family membrane protein
MSPRQSDAAPSTEGPAAGPVPPPEPLRTEGFVLIQRERAQQLSGRAAEWLQRRRASSVPLDVGLECYERDRDAFASVLGSAIALRLFLFQVPAVVAIVGMLNLLAGQRAVGSVLGRAGVTGSVAAQVQEAADTAQSSSIALVVGGLVLTAWAGRSLTVVLAACSSSAWRVSGRDARPTLRMAGSITGLILFMFVAAAVLNRVRLDSGLAAATTSLVVTGLFYVLGWFVVTWTLPRSTRDPGALLPGAIAMGVSMAVLLWFMQFYLPDRISRSSELMGSIGLSVAILGYLFFVGRLMTITFVLNAVIFDRFGSISGLVFSLPGMSRLARTSPRVSDFFDLGPARDANDTTALERSGSAPGRGTDIT